MPDATAKVIQDLVAEYEATQTPESRVAHDADKIETLMQAIEYQAQGYDAAAWRESSLAALRTDSGRQLAQAIASADPHDWWSAFAKSYTELRASTIVRGHEKVPACGQVEVLAGGQLKVPTPRSPCRPGV